MLLQIFETLLLDNSRIVIGYNAESDILEFSK